jgi:hypothetical protein
MKNRIENSKALLRVWKWKEEIYNEIKTLELNNKFKKIHDMAKIYNKKKGITS